MMTVTVTQVGLTNMGFVVFLKSASDPRTLPIFIGAPEAQAIAFVLEKAQAPRPMTHDLFKNVLDNLECRMKRADIRELRDNTFFADIILESNGLETLIDARPSDAIALALRFKAPIRVADEVMNQAGVELPDNEPAPAPDAAAARMEALKQAIAKAVEEERYEDAARLRDELKALTHSN